ncbi:MAG: EthD family reductase [Bradyrhizobium sp.]
MTGSQVGPGSVPGDDSLERSNGETGPTLQETENAEAFDKHYASAHIPLAKKIPGLKKYDISTGAVRTPAGPAEIQLIATLYFDSLDPLKAELASPQGRSRQFCGRRLELYFFDIKEA